LFSEGAYGIEGCETKTKKKETRRTGKEKCSFLRARNSGMLTYHKLRKKLFFAIRNPKN
jgi:hypothetical protein